MDMDSTGSRGYEKPGVGGEDEGQGRRGQDMPLLDCILKGGTNPGLQIEEGSLKTSLEAPWGSTQRGGRGGREDSSESQLSGALNSTDAGVHP